MNWVLMQKNSSLGTILEQTSGWKLIHEDGTAVLFHRRDVKCDCSAGILPAVPRASRPRFVDETWQSRCRRKFCQERPDQASGATWHG